MREWCIVCDAESRRAARSIVRALRNDVAVEHGIGDRRVRAYASTEDAARAVADRILAAVSADGLQRNLITVELRRWDEERRRYVDPAAPDEDPDTRAPLIDSTLAPEEVRWSVRIELDSVFAFRRVRRELPRLERPILGEGNRHLELGARDVADARSVVVWQGRRRRGRGRRLAAASPGASTAAGFGAR